MPKKNEIKKRHNITLADKAWLDLDQIRQQDELKSRSGVIEYLIELYHRMSK
jgi:metal-responsive CopG/Arc/MetJ family transcriptional regulator